MTFEEFKNYSTKVSSEMLFIVITTLEKRLPCSEFYFKERDNFKHEVSENEKMNKKDNFITQSPILTPKNQRSLKNVVLLQKRLHRKLPNFPQT